MISFVGFMVLTPRALPPVWDQGHEEADIAPTEFAWSVAGVGVVAALAQAASHSPSRPSGRRPHQNPSFSGWHHAKNLCQNLNLRLLPVSDLHVFQFIPSKLIVKFCHSGFTMIELIVAIVIPGILTATALPKFIDTRTDPQQAAVSGVAGAAAPAMRLNSAGCALINQVAPRTSACRA